MTHEKLKKYLPIRCVVRQNPDRTIQGLVEESFSMSWSDSRVNIFWSGKAHSMLGEHDLDGVSWSEHNCRSYADPPQVVIDPLSSDSPIEVDWESWLSATTKYDKRNARFKQTNRRKLNPRRMKMAHFTYDDTINFTSRDEYLGFRATWKEAYLGKIQSIRSLKAALKQDMRDNPTSSHWKIYLALKTARSDVVKMVTDKANAAVEAQRQYLAAMEEKNEV